MTEAACTLIAYGFHEIRLHRIEADVSPDNGPSIRLLEKLGFKKEIRFRENTLGGNASADPVIYSLLESDFIRK